MFTGIVTAVGTVAEARVAEAGARIRVRVPPRDPRWRKISLGESIAIDGVCLTAAAARAGEFTADLSAETLARTTAGRWTKGTRVNLERALQVGDRLGGHIVLGHVDGVGRWVEREAVGDAVRATLEAPADLARFVAEKGSITVDGVSLTVNAVRANRFEIMLVPFTLAETTFAGKKPGDRANLEVDVVARYVARLLEPGVAEDPARRGVTMEVLRDHGYAP